MRYFTLSMTALICSLTVAAQEQEITVTDLEVRIEAECGQDIPTPLFNTSCTSDVDIEFTDKLFSGGCAGTIERTYRVTDDCGNSLDVMQYILLKDTTPPVITSELEAIHVTDMAKVRIARPLAEDDCNQKLTWETEDQPFTDSSGSGMTRIFTVSDLCGNTAKTNLKIFIDK